MPEHEPLNLQPLTQAYSTAEGDRDLLLGTSTRVDFGNGIVADIYASQHVLKVETPIALFAVTGVQTVEVSPEGVTFRAAREGYEAICTCAPDGTVTHRLSPLAQPVPMPTPVQEAPVTAPHTPVEAKEPEPEGFQAKFNLGVEPFQVTTPDGPLTVLVAYFREVNGKAITEATSVKIAVTAAEEALVKNPDLVSETNPHGYVFRKGDFVKARLTRREFTQLTGPATKQREKTVKGYGFVVTETDKPTLLKHATKR